MDSQGWFSLGPKELGQLDGGRMARNYMDMPSSLEMVNVLIKAFMNEIRDSDQIV